MTKFHQLNAFTSKKYPTTGNPAGVIFLDKPLTKKSMSKIAAKFGMPMNAFITKTSKPQTYNVRYYDFAGNVCHICGHATVAATGYLITKEEQALKGKKLTFYLDPDLFAGKKEFLETTYGEDDFIEITLPESKLVDKNDDLVLKEAVAKALKVTPEKVVDIRFSANIRDFVIEIIDAKTLENLEPDFAFMKDLANGVSFAGKYEHEGFMCTTRSDKNNWDIKTRTFIPKTGVNEDIACGSGNCSIVPFWYSKGLNTTSKVYDAVFPCSPEVNKFGGIQKVIYYPEVERVKIIAQTDYVSSTEIDPELLCEQQD